jgi:hypothetical protein
MEVIGSFPVKKREYRGKIVGIIGGRWREDWEKLMNKEECNWKKFLAKIISLLPNLGKVLDILRHSKRKINSGVAKKVINNKKLQWIKKTQHKEIKSQPHKIIRIQPHKNDNAIISYFINNPYKIILLPIIHPSSQLNTYWYFFLTGVVSTLGLYFTSSGISTFELRMSSFFGLCTISSVLRRWLIHAKSIAIVIMV